MSTYPNEWELYDMTADRVERNDLAASRPDIVKTLAAEWDAWAERANVDPWAGPRRLPVGRRCAGCRPWPTRLITGTNKSISITMSRFPRKKNVRARTRSRTGGRIAVNETKGVSMSGSDRRAFLSSLGRAGAFAVAGSWLPSIGYAQAGRGPVRAFLRRSPGRGDLDRRVLGSFLEHLGRAIYTGVYEPGSRLADAKGFRTDVAREVKELGVPIVRYPGGNFVSGYNWLDGVGPKAQRPVVLERAWNSLETNQFGTNEFIEWCGRSVPSRCSGMNFGTGTRRDGRRLRRVLQPRRAARSGASSDARTATIGRTTCATGASATRWTGPGRSASCRRASTAARRATPPSRCGSSIRELQLIACGSSGTVMPTYLVWDREVLEECYDQVDGISLHAYYGNTQEWSGNSTARFLAMNLDMDRQIHEVAAVCDYVQGAAASRASAVAVLRRVERLVPGARRRRRRTGGAPPRRGCSRRSTTSRMRCSSAASSTRCSAIRIACASPASRSSST